MFDTTPFVRNLPRHDDNWRQHTVMLEREAHLTALDLLRRYYEWRDMSDLLNDLLKDWNKRPIA